MQTSLFDLLNKKGNYQYKGTCIHYSWNDINHDINQGLYKYIDKWAKWYWRRKKLIRASINWTIWIKTYEMLSTNQSKAKKTNME